MAETYELVGMGPQRLGRVDCWQVTYERPDGQFFHHLFPTTIFVSYAEQFGLDVDDPDDFDEILDIVLHDPFAGDDDTADRVDGPADALMGGSDKKTREGRRMRRRADRGKNNVTITGTQLVRERLRENRHKGVDDLRSRIERVEKHRARSIRQSEPDRRRADGRD